jgi:hypothetical protein
MRAVSMILAFAMPLALAACNSAGTSAPAASAAPPPGAYANLPAGVSPSGFRLPSGTGCSAEVARWKAIQDNDLNTGHVSKSVYDQIARDIEQASAACQAGRDAESQGIIRASRARHGYPAG